MTALLNTALHDGTPWLALTCLDVRGRRRRLLHPHRERHQRAPVREGRQRRRARHRHAPRGDRPRGARGGPVAAARRPPAAAGRQRLTVANAGRAGPLMRQNAAMPLGETAAPGARPRVVEVVGSSSTTPVREPSTVVEVAELGTRLREQVQATMTVSPPVLDTVLATVFAGGHLLVEDHPGVGKTLLARILADSIGGRFGRVQSTVDLLPGDIVGANVWQPGTGEFIFRPGPVFANVVLVDELNRASPKTQSGLLEAME